MNPLVYYNVGRLKEGEVIMSELQGYTEGNGIILDAPIPPDWKPKQRVRILPVLEGALEETSATNTSSSTEESENDGPNSALLAILARAGDLDLPEDFSEQHDHYIYGTPKR
jgi:hypothetical protein